MTDDARVIFRRIAAEMDRRGVARMSEAQPLCAEILADLRAGDVDPVQCLTAAADAGLFPDAPVPARFRTDESRRRVLVESLHRRDYRIRAARPRDLAALGELEEACWAPRLRTPKTVLRRRIRQYPEGQLVLEADDTVAGVIYSQSFENPDALYGVTAKTVDTLFDPSGEVVQLLAVNILPGMQQRNLGDDLLEFMLIYRALQPQVASVVAVTLCKSYDAADGIPLADYIRSRNGIGVLADPILRFHELHGATIRGLVPGYRPADRRNEGCGVLVTYDIRRRRRRDMVSRSDRPRRARGKDIRSEVRDAILGCLTEARAEAFAFDRPLMEMGLDSADLLTLREQIAQRFGAALSPAFFFQHNTAEKIAAFLGDEQTDRPPARPRSRAPEKSGEKSVEKSAVTATAAKTTRPARRRRSAGGADIAIVGMACRLPGGIGTPEAFWDFLEAGRSAIGTLPEGRWTWPDGIDPKGRHRGIDRGGFLDDVAAFDAPFFRISPAEAESMDPQQRLLMELCWQAMEHAGHVPAALAGSRTGVFVGASGSDYARLMDRSGAPAEAHYGTGSSMAVLANRISYFFDFHGPSLLLDTACSASLVALHEAVRSIASGESDQALVGGVNLILHPANSIAYYRAGMLSKDGLCRTFDRRANGYVRGEGAVVMMLKPLKAALADGDRVHAVIRGTACNHGGLASGLTVPNPERQAELLRDAWQAAAIDPRALGYIEAHGTGTSLGDPIEVSGIAQAFGDRPGKGCGLGSVKTNLGHLEAAAGLAGLMKAVLCLRHGQLPPSLNFDRLNEHIDLETAGLRVVDRLEPWKPPAKGGMRLAGVSSFGSGGTNAHAVVEEYPQPVADEAEGSTPVLFVLSARTPERLRAYAESYVAWLGSAAGRSVPLADVVRLLQTGRQPMEARLSLVAADRGELVRQLTEYCARTPGAGTEEGETRADPGRFGGLADGEAGRSFVRALADAGDFEKIGLMWEAGVDIDWSLLDGDAERGRKKVRSLRVSAPTYPFARHRYWVPAGIVPVDKTRSAEDVPSACLLAPIWQPVAITRGEDANGPDAAGRLLIFGGSDAEREAIRAVYADATPVDIDAHATVETLSETLSAAGEVNRIVWVAPSDDAPGGDGASLLGRQEAGLFHLFRLVKALLNCGYAGRPLEITAVTQYAQAVFDGDPVDPAHAGIHGFLTSAVKETPGWSVRLIDRDGDRDWPIRDALALPSDREGEVLALRGGEWFRQAFCPVDVPSETPVPYRQGGVYVVVGGAGGVGEAWTRHVVERYAAQVIWIGRRPLDKKIEARLAALGQLGPEPVYISADAADPEALRAACADIRRRWPAVHGVVHAAVGPFDCALADTDETRFRGVLAAKLAASVHVTEAFAGAFRDQSLDFLLYFSSVVALERNGGYCGYAAGGAFEDAYALHLRARGLPAKVLDWGHWDIGTGAQISDAVRLRQRQSGFLPIGAGEAMQALERFLILPLGQTAVLKSTRLGALAFVDETRQVAAYTENRKPRAKMPVPTGRVLAATPPAQASLFNNAVLDAALLPLLAAILRSAGVLDDAPGAGTHAEAHRRWLRATRELLAERGLDRQATPGLAGAWRDWEMAKREQLQADLAAAISLAEACLKALPDILAGRTPATDVIFPGASMDRVEGVYRGNAVADHFNDLVAECVVADIEDRLRDDPGARLRILEVGAGTGGTTAAVLPRLARYAENIAEYAYTDVSRAFLFHAEERFGAQYPFVRPALFDVEKPIAAQDIDAGRYDVAIATNVLHATHDIRRTLANCKAALRKGGLLLLNEISTRSVFAHVTFGLLDGWWLADDPALRMPDAPGLYPDAWNRVLSQAGFARVAFPGESVHGLGQQVIVAESDGVVCQEVEPSETLRSAATDLSSGQRRLPPEVHVDGDASPKAVASEYLRKLAARTLRMEPEEIDVRAPLEAYGIDSILVVQLTDALGETFSGIDSTLLFDCRTLDAVAEHLVRNNGEELRRLAGDTVPAPRTASSPEEQSAAPPVAKTPPSPEPKAPAPVAGAEPIAVVGMSCRFPSAENVDAYWQLLKDGRNCIGEIPADRWPLDGFYHPDPDEAVAQGKSYAKWGGFLDRVTEFDPLFFNIAPKEAAAIDPQERLFLQTAWETLEDAGYTRERLAADEGGQMGVFVGITRTGFDLFGPELWQRGETIYPHTSFGSVANRLSYFLNVHGPSVPVDTMCSSSLTAIHQACQSLRSGECRVALAGGVNVYLHRSGYVGLSAARMLSPDGQCRSFGRGGNGFVPGEGVAAILLKPLSRAVADGDRIYATIRATHVNHGGKTNGYTVPNPQAQADLVRDALLKAGVDARAVGYIEAHGTGTELGDPIEVAGLTRAFRHFTEDSGFCALGSAKSNIGHLEAAAGIAGFVKAVLQLRHGQLVPSLHADEPNPRIDFAATPFTVQRTLADWPRQAGQPRLAGISSFGAGGANAHVVVEEYVEERASRAVPADVRPVAIVLSAKTEDRLRAAATRLRDHLRRRLDDGDAPSLADVAYTLQVGREQMDRRLGFVASSLDEVCARLDAYLGGDETAGLFVGSRKQLKEIASGFADEDAMDRAGATWLRDGDLDNVLSHWVRGLDMGWRTMYPRAHGCRPVSLPTYPFAAASYWLPLASPAAAATPQPVEPPGAMEAPAAAPAAGPGPIRLRDPADVPTHFAPEPSRRTVTLTPLAAFASPSAAGTGASAKASVVVEDLGDGVYAVSPAGPGHAAPRFLAGEIDRLSAIAKVLVLKRPEGLLDEAGGAVAALRGCAVPVVAELTGDAGEVERALAGGCDVTVRGAGDAVALARDIARAPVDTLTAFKRHMAESSQAVGPADAGSWADGFFWQGEKAAREAPERIDLSSGVVFLDRYPNGVSVVTLCDRESRNTSSPALVDGITEAFARIRSDDGCKAVVLTGYDTYFACGGTRDGLLAIQSGRSNFTDEQSYAEPLRCDVPVIAAMQGHAIGAGWAMGLFSDWTVFAEESVYQSPYMLYGFTPGAGSTLVFPYRLGAALAREVLLTARQYRGRDLDARGIVLPVLPRSQVLGYALALADHLARSERDDLVRRKRRTSAFLRERLEDTFERELALHRRTFVGNPDVVAGIEAHFNVGSSPPSGPAAVPDPSPADLSRVVDVLRETLAEELSLVPADIDDEAAFIDLGMDSISAATWVRKVNRALGLSLLATRVYSHPTLARFAALAAEEMGDGPEAEPVPVEPATAAPAPVSEPAPTAAAEAESGDLLDWLRNTLADELSLPADALDDDAKFVDLGLDSVTSVTWIRTVNRRLGLSVAATAVYSHPTLAAFHEFVAGQGAGPLAPDGDREDVEVEIPPAATSAVEEAHPAAQSVAADTGPGVRTTSPAIAVIGMAGQFPQAADVTQFWRNVVEGRDCVTDIPRSRWSVDAYYDPDRNAPGKTVCRRMGALDDIDMFDPLFFSISPSEAEYMDPQQRLFLQNSWRCIEDAGYDPGSLAGSRCGVFVGCEAGDYADLLNGQEQSAYGLIGESVSILPARIAYFLDLQGPCLSIDTACSASLVAIASACDSLILGNSDLALAGGVYVLTGPDIHVKMSKAGMLSPDGRCYTFDSRANGFVPGEGVGVVLLKRLEDAERDGDDIYAVIRGWGVNQDGKTNGITAPNQESQTRLEADVYRKFGIDPADIQLIEAHGTGTKLGDPIEVEALCQSFAQFTDREGYCALGSVKSNIGHLATAAGVAGIVKSVQALRHRLLPPTINHDAINEHIRLSGSPFYVNTECRPWEVSGNRPRRVAVSSFGFSGTNAHIVLEGREIEVRPVAGGTGPTLVPLSARSAEQLREYARALADHLADMEDGAAASLADVAYTYQVGRPAMTHRLAVVAETTEELRAALDDYALSGAVGKRAWAGEARKPADEAVFRISEGPNGGTPSPAILAEAARRWVAGTNIDWPSLHSAGAVRRLHGLPGYPFARERYWVPVEEEAPEPAPSPAGAAPIQANWSPTPGAGDVDWNGRLRECLQRRVLVVHDDPSLKAGFGDLLAQLAGSAGLPVPSDLVYCDAGDVPGAAKSGDVDVVLVLGKPDNVARAVRELRGARPSLPLVGLVRARTAEAEKVGDRIAEQAGAGILLISVSATTDDATAMQCLFREWLAFGDGAASGGLREVRYEGEARLVRTGTPVPPVDRVHLIAKEWRRRAPEPQSRASARETVLVLVNDDSLRIAESLFEESDFRKVVTVGGPGESESGAARVVDWADPAAARQQAEELIAGEGPVTHVVDLADLHDAVPDPAAEENDYGQDRWGRIAFYQALVAGGDEVSIVHVTRGLQAFRADRPSLAGAGIAGLIKMIGADYRHVEARTVDIDRHAHESSSLLRRIVLDEFGAELREPEVAYRGDVRYAPALCLGAPAGDGRPWGDEPRFDGDAVYVVSGGTNGVGLTLAGHLAERGCRKLVLMGITELPPHGDWKHATEDDHLSPYVREKLVRLIELEKKLDSLEIYTGPLTDRHSLRRYFMKIRATLGPIRGVIHAAAVYSDAEKPGFADKTVDGMRAVWDAKAGGIESLHAVFRADPLDFFVSLSSMTGIVPHLARGAADYAMANAFVDFFSAYRNRVDGDGRYRSIAWSDWNETGAITRVGEEKAGTVTGTFDRIGLRAFSTREGIALFDRALTCETEGNVVIGHVDPSRFDALAPQLLDARPDLPEPAPVRPAPEAEAGGDLEARLAGHIERWKAEKRAGRKITVRDISDVAGIDEIRRLQPSLIHDVHVLLFGDNFADGESMTPETGNTGTDYVRLVTDTVLEVLKLKELDPGQSFQSYGLDSISATVLATRLEKKLKRDVQPKWLIEYPTVDDLSRHLRAEDETLSKRAQ